MGAETDATGDSKLNDSPAYLGIAQSFHYAACFKSGHC